LCIKNPLPGLDPSPPKILLASLLDWTLLSWQPTSSFPNRHSSCSYFLFFWFDAGISCSLFSSFGRVCETIAVPRSPVPLLSRSLSYSYGPNSAVLYLPRSPFLCGQPSKSSRPLHPAAFSTPMIVDPDFRSRILCPSGLRSPFPNSQEFHGEKLCSCRRVRFRPTKSTCYFFSRSDPSQRQFVLFIVCSSFP